MVSFLATGQYIAQVAILDSTGYPMGTLITPDSPTPGTVYTPYLIPSVVDYTAPTPTSDEASSRAGMKLRGRVDLGVTDHGIGTLQMSELDDVFDALVMKTVIDVTTATNIRHRAANSLRIATRRFLLMLSQAAVTSDSVVKYNTFYLTNVWFRSPRQSSNAASGVNPNNRSYEVMIRTNTRLPWGQLYSANSVAVTGNADTEGGLYASAPVALATYVDDGSATSFTFPYLPDSSENAGADNIFFKNGATAHASVSAFSVSTGVVTNTAGSSGDKWVVLAPSTALLSA